MHCTALFTVLQCTTLHYSALHTVRFVFILHFTVLYYTTVRYVTILHCTVTYRYIAKPAVILVKSLLSKDRSEGLKGSHSVTKDFTGLLEDSL